MWLFKDIILVVGCLIMAVISIIGAVGVVFDIQQIRGNIGFWGLTWLEFLFGILVVAFWVVAIRLILRLNKYEKARPSLWVRGMGIAILDVATPTAYPYRIAYHFDVNLANTSTEKSLGIRSLLLRRKYGDITLNIRPTIGMPISDNTKTPTGDIDGDFILEPCASKSGKLLFVEEIRNSKEKERLSKHNAPPFVFTIIIIDGQNIEHLFVVQPKDITWQ